jgi:hypothetical protein
MSYTKTNWVNGTTKLNASNMNKIEDGIDNATPIVGQETVSTASWTATTTGGFAHKKDVPITGVTSSDYPIIAFVAASYEAAADAGITYIETYDGGITLYALEVPSITLTFDYMITKG